MRRRVMRARARPRWHLVLSLTCLMAMFLYGLINVHDEWRIARLMQAQADQIAGRRTAVLAAQRVHDGDEASALPARGAMVRAVIRLREAAGETGRGQRRTLIAGGFADAMRAEVAMPHSGEAALTMAYAYVMRDGAGSPMALRHFMQSYVIHPYLRDSAEWRLRYAVLHWHRLDPATRAAVANEGRWLRRLASNGHTHIYVLTGGSPVWRAIMQDSSLHAPHRHDRF
jgi:hypothetical protein